jgi:hypothetical protein
MSWYVHSSPMTSAILLPFPMTSTILLPFFCTCTHSNVHGHVRPAGAWLPLIGFYTACQWLLFQYIPVHTRIYWYVRVCTSTYWYVLAYSTYQYCMYWYIVHTRYVLVCTWVQKQSCRARALLGWTCSRLQYVMVWTSTHFYLLVYTSIY